jgi:hypothetical protein
VGDSEVIKPGRLTLIFASINKKYSEYQNNRNGHADIEQFKKSFNYSGCFSD